MATRLCAWCAEDALKFGCSIVQEVRTRHLILVGSVIFQTPLDSGMFEHLLKQIALHNRYEDQGFDSDKQIYRTQLLPKARLPQWIHTTAISTEDKQLYGYLLWLRQEVWKPGRNALVIQLEAVGSELYPAVSFPASLLSLRLMALERAGIITARKLEYPDDHAECWEITFLREELV